MKTLKKKNREYVYINGIRYIKQSGFLVLDQVIRSTIDNFHIYNRLQIN